MTRREAEHPAGDAIKALLSWLSAAGIFAVSLIIVWINAFSSSGKPGADPHSIDAVMITFLVVYGSVSIAGVVLTLVSRSRALTVARWVLGLVALASVGAVGGMWIATGGM